MQGFKGIEFQAHLYIGLAIFCGFIMFDTQVIIRKARNGDKDFIAHSLDLFIDFVQIFRKVLILLMQKVGSFLFVIPMRYFVQSQDPQSLLKIVLILCIFANHQDSRKVSISPTHHNIRTCSV